VLCFGEKRLKRRVAPLPGGIGTAKQLVEDDKAAVNAIVSVHALLLLASGEIRTETGIGLVIADPVPLWFTGLFCALSLGSDN